MATPSSLPNDPISRVQQVLEIASHEVRAAQENEAADYRVEGALADCEDLLATARAGLNEALEEVQEDREQSGAAERERQRWRPPSF